MNSISLSWINAEMLSTGPPGIWIKVQRFLSRNAFENAVCKMPAILVRPINLDKESTLQWRHNGRDSVSNHQPHHCLLNRLFRCRSKKTPKLRATSLCAGNSPGTGEFPAQMASNAENVSIWWRHHECWLISPCYPHCVSFQPQLTVEKNGSARSSHSDWTSPMWIWLNIDICLSLIKKIMTQTYSP